MTMSTNSPALSTTGAKWMLLAGFTAWMFAGLENGLFVLIHRQMMRELLGPETAETIVTQWFAWNQAAFMLGAALGGWCFGWLGDRAGRTKALGWSVLCYSLLTLAGWFVHDAHVMWGLRFLACLGFGGTWPNAVALVAEAYPTASRPFLAGLLGTAANFGFVLIGFIGFTWPVTDNSWRWTLIVGGSPAILGAFILWKVPESARWLSTCKLQALSPSTNGLQPAGPGTDKGTASPFIELFSPPLLQRTLLGIALGAVPVIGTAANANWVVPWTDQVAARRATETGSDQGNSSTVKKPKQSPKDKAWTMITRSSGAVVGSLLGGIIASLVGRRLSYFLISLGTFGISTWLFTQLTPGDPNFSFFVFLLGFFGVSYFGWLPLFLPELFPTRVRSTGIGISFNSGRIAAALVVIFVGLRMSSFEGDYAMIGFWTGLIYVVGMLVIWLAPRNTQESVPSK